MEIRRTVCIIFDWNSIQFLIFLKIFKNVFFIYFEREREREHERRRGRDLERERERGRESQAGPTLSAQTPTGGLISQTVKS